MADMRDRLTAYPGMHHRDSLVHTLHRIQHERHCHMLNLQASVLGSGRTFCLCQCLYGIR